MTTRTDPRLADPRFAILAEIGMHQRWIRLAEMIGMEAFLTMWKLLDEDETRAGTSLLFSMPRLVRYLRYCRNATILELHGKGRDIQEIQHFVTTRFGEVISNRHIARIIERREGHDPAG